MIYRDPKGKFHEMKSINDVDSDFLMDKIKEGLELGDIDKFYGQDIMNRYQYQKLMADQITATGRIYMANLQHHMNIHLPDFLRQKEEYGNQVFSELDPYGEEKWEVV